MARQDSPCRKCNSFDWYVKGSLAFCRPCHSEAQKRYAERKKLSQELEKLKPPKKLLSDQTFTNHHERKKLVCKNGHPYDAENTLLTSQRGGRHVRRFCRTCERNAKRVKYGVPLDESSSKLTDLLKEE